MADEVLSLKEVAARIGLSIEGVRTWLKDGRLPFAYYKLGNRVVCRASEVDAWFEAQRVPSAQELQQVTRREGDV